MSINTNQVNPVEGKDRCQVAMYIAASQNGESAITPVDWRSSENVSRAINILEFSFNPFPFLQFFADLFAELRPVQFTQASVLVYYPPKNCIFPLVGIIALLNLNEENIQKDKLFKTADCIRSFVEENSEISVLEKCLDRIGFTREEISKGPNPSVLLVNRP